MLIAIVVASSSRSSNCTCNCQLVFPISAQTVIHSRSNTTPGRAWRKLRQLFDQVEKQRKEEEKQAKAEERRQSLTMREAEKQAEAKAAADARKAKVAAANAVAKIKSDASKASAKLASSKVDIEQYTERGEWESVPQFMKLKAESYRKELSAMYDEAKDKDKFSSNDPAPVSFDMSTLNRIVSDGKSIHKSFKEFGQSHRADA